MLFSLRSLAAGLLMSGAAQAGVLEVQQVTDGVYALVGPNVQRSPENLANNATFGIVVTSDGVVLIDPGGSWKGAEAIDEEISAITDQPVRFVINTGGQDHRWLGNGYWKAQGAEIIASAAAVTDQADRSSLQFTALEFLLGDELAGTEPVQADVIFDEDYAFSLGGLEFEVLFRGAAHTPGDAFVWVPGKGTVFTGDIVYVDRILTVGSQSTSSSWLAAFEAMAELEPEYLVPGHGRATDLQRATSETYDYLVNLRTRMAEHIDSGGDIIGSVEVDQSAFAYLEQFDVLARRNAQQVFEEMEWE